jgi:hypothetical protein
MQAPLSHLNWLSVQPPGGVVVVEQFTSSLLSQQSFSPSQIQSRWMQAVVWLQLTMPDVSLNFSLDTPTTEQSTAEHPISSLASGQSGSLSQTSARRMQTPLAHRKPSSGQLQFTSSELSPQSFFPSHTDAEETQRLLLHANKSFGHLR